MVRGGLGTFAMELTSMQVKKGNEVTVFTLNENNSLLTQDNYKGVEVHRPKTPDFSSTLRLFADHELRSWGEHFKFFSDVVCYNALSASKLVHFLVGKVGRMYDIIDAHDWLGIMGGMSAKGELKIPLVFHVHSTEKGRTRGKGSRTIEDIEYEGGEMADCIMTVSEAMGEELHRMGFPTHKTRICWNGVDTEKYDPMHVSEEEREKVREIYGVRDSEKLLFHIGRLVGVKGSDYLLRSMPIILEEFPDTKLVILGEGDMEGYLRQQIAEMKLENNVVLRSEFIPEDQRIRHYAAADVVVLPSLYEPFGIVCTEAMSMGKPVVVGAKGTNGMKEQVVPKGNKQCGFHINPFDPNDIAWGVKQILSMEDCGLWMGTNGRERAIRYFDWKISAARILDVYREYIG